MNLTRVLFVTAAPIAFALSLPNSADARQQIREAFFAVYPEAVGTQLDDVPSLADHCGVCHYRFTGGGTRNPYGVALGAVLPNYPNNDNGRRQAVGSIENADSDGDGYTTLIEATDVTHYANTPTFPGLTPLNVHLVTQVDVADILPYLVPTTGTDTTPPQVTVLSPNGGESWVGGDSHNVTWFATDNVGVTSVDVFYRDSVSDPWHPIAMGLTNGGTFDWFVHNTPSPTAAVRVVARDAMNNPGEDQSNGAFTIQATPGGIVPTTLRDFEAPGTQPFGAAQLYDRTACAGCHAGYDPESEPDHGFQGSMMAQAARDPVFFAAVAIAEQDAPSSGDLCLRCHTPLGWLSGRSNPTNGERLTSADRDGVTCHYCHRAVDPIYKPGISPSEDVAVLAELADVPAGYSNGQYVVDPEDRRRGPYADPVAPHAFLPSPFHQSSEFCGTCHDVSNPVFERVSGQDYAPNPLDAPATDFDSSVLLPLERTYSEWKNSEFAIGAGVYAPEFAGSKPDGFVSSCQDCHLADVIGEGCNDPGAPTRSDLGFHDMTGGNTWVPGILDEIYPDEVDAAKLADGAARAVSMLHRAALLDLTIDDVGDGYQAAVTVTNRTGHKLPTGYPEGRRMWIHLVAWNDLDEVVFESGAYDAGTGVLTEDEHARVYEVKLGVSPGFAGALGLSHGPSFHFTLNDSVYQDNRIPPLGFANANFDVFGGVPTDPEWTGPGPRYPDGQNWDLALYQVPATAVRVAATLYYQTISKQYVEFLRDENTTDLSGQTLHDLWTAAGRAAPFAMVGDTISVVPTSVNDDAVSTHLALRLEQNPARGIVSWRLDTPRPSTVVTRVIDVAGRCVYERAEGLLPAGPHRLQWDGRSTSGVKTPSGIYWIQIVAGNESTKARVIRLE